MAISFTNPTYEAQYNRAKSKVFQYLSTGLIELAEQMIDEAAYWKAIDSMDTVQTATLNHIDAWRAA